MSVVTFCSPVSLFLWYVYFVNGVQPTEEAASVDCDFFTCSSEEYKLQKCVVEEDVKIVNISVDTILSRTICVKAQDYLSDDNEDIGFYGYNENILWADKGCSAKFEICYTEGASVDCDFFTCSSEEYKLQKCEVDKDVKIVNISVDTILSRTKCVNAQDYFSDDNEDIGFYGYNENILWADKGCSAKFEICYTEGASVDCDFFTCSSEEYKLQKCEVDEDVKIVNISVDTILSRTKCVNAQDYFSDDNEDIGFYGYNENILWADKGCSAKFEICYTEGASVDCDFFTCSSEEYKLQKCEVDEDVKIVNISVDTILSRTKCVNAQDYFSDDNEDIGFYGYNENIFWVDKGCSAKFEICYKVCSLPASPTSTSPTAETSSFTSSSSMISSPPTTLSVMFTTENYIDPIPTTATETTRETSSPTTEFYGAHSQTQKQHQQDSSDTTVVIIVVAIVAGVLVLGIIGIILCRIRYKRNGARRKESKSVLDNKTEMISNTAHDFINSNGYKTHQVKIKSDASAETQRQVNAYDPISNGAAGLRKEINKNQEFKKTKRPIPAKRHIAKDNAKKVTKCNTESVKSSKDNSVGVSDTEVRDELTEQSDDYLEPVSNRSSLEEYHNYIDLQPETEVKLTPSTAIPKGNTDDKTDDEDYGYDYINPNYVPDTLS